MTGTITFPRRFRLPPSVFVFIGGAALLFTHIFLSEHFAPGGHFRTPTAFRHFDLPLVAVSALICIFSPLVSRRPWLHRLFFLPFTAVAFGVLLWLSVLVSLSLFGLPDRD